MPVTKSWRVGGHEGPITLVSEESPQPYSRVSLSEGVLAGVGPLERALLSAPGSDVDSRSRDSATKPAAQPTPLRPPGCPGGRSLSTQRHRALASCP